jgi:hypothetical protein
MGKSVDQGTQQKRYPGRDQSLAEQKNGPGNGPSPGSLPYQAKGPEARWDLFDCLR